MTSTRKPRVSRRPAKAHVTIRIPPDVLEWFKTASHNYSQAIREALIEYVRNKES